MSDEQWRQPRRQPTISGNYYLVGFQRPADEYVIVEYDSEDGDVWHPGGMDKLRNVQDDHVLWAGPIPGPITKEA